MRKYGLYSWIYIAAFIIAFGACGGNGEKKGINVLNKSYFARENLNGWWKFDEDLADQSSGKTFAVNSGTDATFASGQYGSAVSFSPESKNSLSITDSTLFGRGSFTIAFWARSRMESGSGIFLSKGKSQTDGWRVTFASGYLRVLYDEPGSSKVAAMSNFQGIALNTWAHVVLVFDRSAGTYGQIRSYINGVLQSSRIHDLAFPLVDNDLRSFVVGSNDETALLWDGDLDDLRVYSSVLSQDDVTSLFSLKPDDIPAAPDGLTAAADSSESIALQWNDNASNEEGYIIERSADAAGPFTEIANVEPDVTGYTDAIPDSGSAFYYRVKAYSIIGDSSYSNVALYSVSDASETTPLLKGNWRFEENLESETGENNLSAGGTDAPTYISGKFGNALSFSPDVKSYAYLSPSDDVTTDTFTIVCWARSRLASGSGVFISKGKSQTDGWRITFSSGYIRVLYDEAGVNKVAAMSTFEGIALNEWAHIVLVFDRSAGTYGQIRSYINGVHQTSRDYNLAFPLVLNDARELVVGASEINGTVWDGDIDELKIYSSALTDAEVEQQYNSTPSEDDSALLPSAPGSLSLASVTSSSVDLKWNDNSTNEDGFILERRDSDSLSFIERAEISANTVSSSDTGLVAETTYSYRIAAYNIYGVSAYSSVVDATTLQSSGELIIADHTVVDKYSIIPDRYIETVKSMLLNIPGESHGAAYRTGCVLLSEIDSRFAVTVSGTSMLDASTDYLRITDAYRNEANDGWNNTGGEEDFWTSDEAVSMMKQHLTYMRTTAANPVSVFGFAWCYDMTSSSSGTSSLDSVYGVHWYGRSYLLDGSNAGWFGLDSGDSAISMQTYLDAVETYISHDPETVTFFSTGPVDSSENTGECGYQRSLKHQYIRDYVSTRGSGVLFDYADIVSWNDSGEEATTTWNGNTFQVAHPDNLTNSLGETDTSIGHIGEKGALRVGKAVWWMMARIAGWDGTSE